MEARYEDKEDFLRDLSKKAVEKVNDMYPDEPPMKWPESPKKPGELYEMITKKQALQIYFDHERDRIIITDETPMEPIYGTHEDCWYVYPPGRLAIGSRRVVVISKVDGRILFDGDIGE